MQGSTFLYILFNHQKTWVVNRRCMLGNYYAFEPDSHHFGVQSAFNCVLNFFFIKLN